MDRYLVSQNAIKPMCDLLTVMDSKIVQVSLNGLENILRLGEHEAKQNGSGINPYCALIEEAYGKHFNAQLLILIKPKAGDFIISVLFVGNYMSDEETLVECCDIKI